MKLVKVLTTAIIVIPLFSVLLVLVALISVKPETFIPAIEKELLTHNLKADFSGELSWHLYPNVGINLSNVTLQKTGSSQEKPLLQIKSANFSMKLFPLLKQQIEINGISLKVSSAYLHIDKNGNPNWPTSPDEPEQATKPNVDQTANSTAPSINIEQVVFDIEKLRYEDQTSATKVHFKEVSFTSQHINLNNNAFPFSLQAIIESELFPKAQLSATGQLSTDLENNTAEIYDTNVIATMNKSSKITTSSNFKLSWKNALLLSGNIQITVANVKKLLQEFNIDLPKTRDNTVFNQGKFISEIDFDSQQLLLKNTSLQIDNINLKGNSTVLLSDNKPLPAVRSHWNATTINIDNYLPPKVDEATSEPKETGDTVASPLPLELLRELDLDTSLKVDTIFYEKQTYKNFLVAAKTQNGTGKLDLNMGNAFDAKISFKSLLTTEPKKAKIQSSGTIENINIGHLVQAFTETNLLEGVANSQFTAITQGKTDQDLINNLQADIDMQSPKILINPINIEQQFCTVIALLEKKELTNKDWAAFTPLSPLSITAKYRTGAITLQNFSTTVNTLTTTASGTLDVNSQQFDFPLTVKLAGNDFNTGCGIIKEQWRNLAVPIRCNGSISDIGINTCLPDKTAIASFLKAKTDARLKAEEDKIEKKITEKREETKKKATEKLEKEAGKLIDKKTGDELEDTWKKLLKKRL